MTDVDDWTVVDDNANDKSILAALHRAEICDAIRTCAEVHHGIVSSATVREFLPEAVNPNLIGNIMNNLGNRGALIKTGRHVESNNAKSRNRHRLVHEWAVPNKEEIK